MVSKIIPSGDALGAEISEIDLSRPLDPEAVAFIKNALLEHLVLVFRDQRITDHEQVRFTSYFGKPVEHVRKQRERDVKEIFIISNVKENGEPIGALGDGEITFHSDLSYLKTPGTISMLYAVELPDTGGDTQWCNCYTAYEALDESMKERLRGLRAVHRHYVEEQNPPELVDHPIVRTHPESGRKCLYVGPHLTKHIVGLPESESRALLAQLASHVSQPEFIYTHQWRLNDLVIWDNRPTMHRRFPFPADQRRVMKRTQILSEEVPA